ncbi:MAG: hypothetical protein QF437_14220 [Planctomycetota bacterium]|jgi:hypothetical protein|nr:hypothetical protein [Planctomycetota bacterium]MDP7131648.1 hypothetical protein [Planctomycetota bacterium]|tara:strand:+ start:194 stop:493 length:300 start_codon:yes stop_codon:yes gene_type:complete
MEYVLFILVTVLMVAFFLLKFYGYQAKEKGDIRKLRIYYRIVGPIMLLGSFLFLSSFLQSQGLWWLASFLVFFFGGLVSAVNPDFVARGWVGGKSRSNS